MVQATTDTHFDQIKLPFTFDVAKMEAEIQTLAPNHFVYYNVLNLRSPAHLVDPSLPIPPPAEDYADGSWTDWMNIPRLDSCPYFSSIIDFFNQHTDVTLVRLLRLAPQSEVREHTDPTLALQVHKSVIRLTVPILINEGVQFFLDGNVLPMQPGECWYIDLTRPHRIINAGNSERINLTIDMIPNDWVREQIATAQASQGLGKI